MLHVEGRGEVRAGLLREDMSQRGLGRPRSGWVDNIKVDLEDLGCSTWTSFI
jgi:hypothetical protein